MKPFAELNTLRLRIRLKAVENVFLTEYNSAIFFGLFKTALRHHLCQLPGSNCRPDRRNKKKHGVSRSCCLARHCLYAYAAEHVSETGEDTVLPFVLFFPHKGQRYVPEGGRLSLELTLLGKLADHAPEIIASLENWKNYDLSNFSPFYSADEVAAWGKIEHWPREISPRGGFSLEAVEQLPTGPGNLIYQNGVLEKSPRISPLKLFPAEENENFFDLTLSFKSPLRLFKKKKFISKGELDFSIFYHAVARRVINLVRYFGTVADERVLSEQKERCHKRCLDVKMSQNHLKTVLIGRGRSSSRYNYQGLTGTVMFQDVPSDFLYWFELGELLHAGKSPTMGMGKFELKATVKQVPVKRKNKKSCHGHGFLNPL